MKHIITTSVGDFSVELSYQPVAEDTILNRFTAVINHYAIKPMAIVVQEYPDKTDAELEDLALSLMEADEEEIQHQLYETTHVPGGAGLPLSFSIKRKEIIVSNS